MNWVPKRLPWTSYYLNDPDTVISAFEGVDKTHRLVDAVRRGGMPDCLDESNDTFGYFFNSYMRSYVEKDVRLYADPRDLDHFDVAP